MDKLKLMTRDEITKMSKYSVTFRSAVATISMGFVIKFNLITLFLTVCLWSTGVTLLLTAMKLVLKPDEPITRLRIRDTFFELVDSVTIIVGTLSIAKSFSLFSSLLMFIGM